MGNNEIFAGVVLLAMMASLSVSLTNSPKGLPSQTQSMVFDNGFNTPRQITRDYYSEFDQVNPKIDKCITFVDPSSGEVKSICHKERTNPNYTFEAYRYQQSGMW